MPWEDVFQACETIGGTKWYIVEYESDAFPPLARPFTVQELGGWSQAYAELVETLWQLEIEPRLNLEPAPRLLDTRGE